MTLRTRPLVLAFNLVVTAVTGSWAASPGAPEGMLDTRTIHEQYREGDFDAVVAALEGFMRRNQAFSHRDSVFIAKHLAVVYTASPATREKGRYYMHRLLELLPSAKLVDMYVSEEIDRIFDKVREEFAARHESFEDPGARAGSPGRPVGGDSAGPVPGRSGAVPVVEEPSAKSPPGQPKPAGRIPAGEGESAGKKRNGPGTALWVAGGAGLLAAGLAGYYFMHGEPDPGADRIFTVPSR